MKEHPILFSGPMVKSILDGEKTMTRRVVKNTTEHKGPYNPAYLERWKNDPGWSSICPYGQPGDLLWVREAWRVDGLCRNGFAVEYAADGQRVWFYDQFEPAGKPIGVPRSSIFMPRWASRITLEITAVRVERVQDITEEDAIAEGISGPHDVGYPAYKIPGDTKPRYSRAAAAFEDLWDSLHAKDGFDWKSNPLVWAISFKRIKP